MLAFLLSPEARDLRPLLVGWLVNGLDLFARDRARKAYAGLATLAPRLPFLGPLPMPPKPPVLVRAGLRKMISCRIDSHAYLPLPSGRCVYRVHHMLCCDGARCSTRNATLNVQSFGSVFLALVIDIDITPMHLWPVLTCYTSLPSRRSSAVVSWSPMPWWRRWHPHWTHRRAFTCR